MEFKRVAENVKRLSAWLDKIVLEMEEKAQMYVGIIEHDFTSEAVTQQRDGNEFHGFFAQLGVVEEYIMKGE